MTTETRTCSACQGTQTRHWRPSWAPEGIDPESWSDRLQGLAASLVSYETSCPTCGGTGELEEIRPKRLDELSGIQLSFLLEADMAREGVDEGTQQELERAKQQTNHQPGGTGPTPGPGMSPPSGHATPNTPPSRPTPRRR